MLQFETLEDHRGIDISQIRTQLRMTFEERVHEMVQTANMMMEIQQTAQDALRRKDD